MKKYDLLLGVLVAAIWGVNFSVIKLGLDTIDPFLLAAMRFGLAGFPMVLFLPKPNVPFLVIAAYGVLFGLGLWGVANLGVFLGLSAGIASLLLQFTVFTTILFGYVFFKESLAKNQYIGLLLSLIGLIFVVQVTDGSVSLVGVLCIFFAATSWSLSNVLIKKYKPNNMLAFIVWGCVFAPIPLALMSYITKGSDPFYQLMNMDGWGLFSVVFQAYITTLFGYYIWNNLMAKYPVSLVAPLSLLIPVFGFMGSYFIFNESISSEKIIGFSLVLTGLMFFIFDSNLYRKIVAARF